MKNQKLNETQIMILRMFDKPMSSQESEDIRQLLNNYYKSKLDAQVQMDISRKKISQKDYDNLDMSKKK